MGSFLADIRFGLRTLRKSPTFTIVAVLTLALGIGANTAMFGALNAFVLRPFPFHDPARLVMLWEANPQLEGFLAERVPVCLKNFLDWKSQSKSFTDMAAMKDENDFSLTGVDKPEQLEVGIVSPDFFSVLGTGMAIGRPFVLEEGDPGRDHVAVLTSAFFDQHFGRGANYRDKQLQLNRETYRIVGVLPAGFHLPAVWGGMDQKKPQLFVPLNLSSSQPRSVLEDRRLMVYARLKPGIDLSQARAEMKVIARGLEQKDPELNKGFTINLFNLRTEDVGSDTRLALVVLQYAVGFVLLIACANLANLLLARAAGRSRETAVRMALGASRARVIRQFMVESMVLSFAGGAAGLVLAVWAIGAINKFAPADLLGTHVLQLDVRVFAFTFATIACAGLLFGIAPAIHSVRQNINETLAHTSRAVLGGSRRLRSALVILEITFSVALLVGAGLTLHSLYTLRHVNPGFVPDHLLTAMIRLPKEVYSKPEQITAFDQQLLQEARSLPGVKSAALVDGLPMQNISATGFTIEDQPLPSKTDYRLADRRVVTENYFSTMGSPLVRGRSFTRQETESASPGVIMVNETMAKKFWPGQDPIGKVIIHEKLRYRIVGVVADSHQLGLDTAPRAEMYFPGRVFPMFSIVIRTTGDPMELANSLTAAVRALDRDLPVSEIHSMTEVVNGTMGQERFGTTMMLIFAVLALVLSAVGLYGVLGYLVAQRTQEIGIRLALGAQRSSVLRMVIRQGVLLTVAGVVLGLAASLVVGRLVASLLYGISPLDPLTFVTVAAVLMIVSLAASLIPAWRASRLDPMVALRHE